MRVFVLAVIFTLISGCGKAVMVEAPYPWPKYGPLNATEQGLVAYTASISNAHTESGKFSAYRLMERACHGSYVILYPIEQREPPVSTVQNAEASTTTRRYIRFRCEPHAQRYNRNPDPRFW